MIALIQSYENGKQWQCVIIKPHYNHVHLLFTSKCFTDYRFTLEHSWKLFSFKFNQSFFFSFFFPSFFFFPFREKCQLSDVCSHPLLRLLSAVPGGDSVNSLKNVKAFYKSFGFSRRGRKREGRGMIEFTAHTRL